MATLYHRSGEKKRIAQEFRRQEEEVIGSLCRLSNRPISPKTQLEQEKRIRREIANSNERRRMQSINAGFQSLRTLLPHHEGEKLSKAAILQHTADYIYQLEQEKTRLLSQNCQLKRLVNSQSHDSDGSCSESPLPKRKKIESVESVDEGIGNMSPPQNESSIEEVKREMIELRVQLDRERRLRMFAEEQSRKFESQLYPERIREIAHQVQLQFQKGNAEDSFKPLSSALNMMLDGVLTSPQSQLSSEEVESSHENPTAETETSPEHDIPEDLSGKASKHPMEEVVIKAEKECESPELPIVQIPEQIEAESSVSPADASKSQHPAGAIPIVDSVPLHPLYSASTSRQNLETIVEAIRHLEGDHLFQDDPEPCERSEFRKLSLQERPVTTNEQVVPCISGEFAAFHHQIIQNAPINQLRPGVIVSNHS